MTTVFPAAIDDIPTSGMVFGEPVEPGPIETTATAVEALEAKVGVDGSAVTTSLDYMVRTRGLLTGSGVPGGGTGVDGNLYLNTATGIIYQKAGGVWSAIYTPGGGGVTAGVWPSAESGFKTWAYDPAMLGNVTSLAATTGLLTGIALYNPSATTTSTSYIAMQNAGTVTGAYMALYNAAGTLLGQSTDSSAQFGTSGLKSFTYSAPVNVPQGLFYACVWLITSSAPNFQSSTPLFSEGNFRVGAADFRFFTANSGLSTTAPASLGAKTNITRSIWAAIS